MRTILWFVAAVAAGDLAVPFMRWTQSSKLVQVSFLVSCSEGSDAVRLSGTDEIALSCTDEDGTRKEVRFVLREDIIAKSFVCVNGTGDVTCTMKKPQPHQWDMLTIPVDHKRLKRFLKRDWRKSPGTSDKRVDDELEIDDEGIYDGNGVTMIPPTGKAFSRFLEKHEFAVLDVALPWCGECKHAKEGLVTTARMMRGDSVVFGRVDAVEVKEARSYKPWCSEDCRFFVHRRGEKQYVVDWENDEEGLVRLLRLYGLPLFETLSSDEEEKAFVAKGGVRALVRAQTETDAIWLAAREAAQTLRTAKPIWGGRLGVDAGLRVIKQEVEREEIYKGPQDIFSVTRWVNLTRRPLLRRYRIHDEEEIDAMSLPHVELFLEEELLDRPDLVEAKNVALAVARRLQGEVVFLWLDSVAERRLIDEFGFDRYNAPVLGLATAFSEPSKRYAYEKSWDEDVLEEWIREALAGKLTRSFRSEPKTSGTRFRSGQLQRLVGKTMPAAVKASHFTFVVFYKAYAPGRAELLKAMEKMAASVRVLKRLAIAVMETNDNGYDTELFFKTDRQHLNPICFLIGGARSAVLRWRPKSFSVRGALKWLRRNLTSVDARWKAIQADLEHEDEEERALRLEAEAFERKEREALEAEGMMRVNLTEDGGISKYIRANGTEAPQRGEQVTIHFVSRLAADGTETDRSDSSGQRFHNRMGEVLQCWDTGVGSMTLGEKAIFFCTAEYAFGDIGNAPHVKPGATLRYDIHLANIAEGIDPPEEEEGEGGKKGESERGPGNSDEL
eukprot:Hpha_TRINITY_DN1054_c0_g1::TRINITY_DN1054_c0_g1_i1::g.84718::m.84718